MGLSRTSHVRIQIRYKTCTRFMVQIPQRSLDVSIYRREQKYGRRFRRTAKSPQSRGQGGSIAFRSYQMRLRYDYEGKTGLETGSYQTFKYTQHLIVVANTYYIQGVQINQTLESSCPLVLTPFKYLHVRDSCTVISTELTTGTISSYIRDRYTHIQQICRKRAAQKNLLHFV